MRRLGDPIVRYAGAPRAAGPGRVGLGGSLGPCPASSSACWRCSWPVAGTRIGDLPAPSPANFPSIAAQLAAAGITVTDQVSGDAGCKDSAARVRPRSASPPRASTSRAGPDPPLHLRRPRDLVRACELGLGLRPSFVTDPETYESVEPSPYVLAGQGPWGTQFRDTLRQVLTTAAGDGGNGSDGGGGPGGQPRAQTDPQAEDLAGDDEPLDLARPLADLGQLGVAQEALDRVLGRRSRSRRGPGSRRSSRAS